MAYKLNRISDHHYLLWYRLWASPHLLKSVCTFWLIMGCSLPSVRCFITQKVCLCLLHSLFNFCKFWNQIHNFIINSVKACCFSLVFWFVNIILCSTQNYTSQYSILIILALSFSLGHLKVQSGSYLLICFQITAKHVGRLDVYPVQNSWLIINSQLLFFFFLCSLGSNQHRTGKQSKAFSIWCEAGNYVHTLE